MTWKQVEEIRAAKKSGMTIKTLAQKYGISREQARNLTAECVEIDP